MSEPSGAIVNRLKRTLEDVPQAAVVSVSVSRTQSVLPAESKLATKEQFAQPRIASSKNVPLTSRLPPASIATLRGKMRCVFAMNGDIGSVSDESRRRFQTVLPSSPSTLVSSPLTLPSSHDST